MFNSRVAKAAVGLWAAALFWLVCPGARAQGEGEKVYKAKCAACHGADGSGKTPVAKALNLRSFCAPEVRKETVAEMTEITAKGKNKMPAYEKQLSPAEIKDVVAYLRTLCK
jgi:mono/diheme cytochrome c family protein